MKKYLILLLLLFGGLVIQAQKKVALQFDKTGSLLKGMPGVLNRGDTVLIKIPFDKKLFRTQIDSIKLRIIRSIVFWNDSTNIKNAEDFFSETEIKTLKMELDSFYKCLEAAENNLLTAACNVTYTYLPAANRFIETLKKQFKVISKCKGDNCNTDITLIGPLAECEDWCYSATCIVGADDLSIQVFKIDPIKNFIIDFYNQQLNYFDHAQWIISNESKDTSEIVLKKYLTSITRDTIPDNKICDIEETLRKYKNTWEASLKYHFATSQQNKLKKWLFGFAWLNNGQLQTNPFTFTNEQFYQPAAAKPDPKPSNEYTIAEKLIDSIIKIKRKPDTKSYADLILAISKKDSLLASIKKSDPEAANQKAAEDNSKRLTAMQQAGMYLNNVKAPVFTGIAKYDTVRMRNYYYGKDPIKTDFKYLYPENEKMLFPVHNVPGVNNIVIEDKIEIYAEQPQFVKDGITFIDSAASLFALLNPYGASISKLSKLFNKVPIPTATKPESYNGQTSLDSIRIRDSIILCKKQFNQMIDSINLVLKIRTFIDSLAKASQIPPLALNKEFNAKPEVRTVIASTEVADAPNKHVYKLTAVVDTTSPKKALMVIDSSYYKVGKLRLIEFGAGIAYSLSPVRITNIDTSGGKFDITNDEDKIRLVLGLKFHIKKIFWGDNRFVLEKTKRHNMLDRLYGFVGVSVPKPLNNFYTGVGIDLIPGLSITTGAHWYQNKKYTISNNQITGQSLQYQPSLYLGITTDPTLLAALLKTIIKP